ncbi:GntR family transcriptional regulator [Kribbella hippodromi]|uniref:GntR family transcriptional regulator n=1 Tax=Kribbella hippodromi TaxID=434347 RepID=A0ABP4QBI3_9ACTN
MHKYEQILEDLSGRIATLEPGARIPTEKELAAEFDASTMTVRRALQILIQNGQLRGVPGRGTFVAHPRVTKMIASAASFTDAMRSSGRRPTSLLVEAAVRPSSAEEAGWFDVREGAPVYSIKRVRLGDGVPLGFEVATLNAGPFPGLLGANLEHSLYDTLTAQFGIDVVRRGIVVSTRCPRPDEAAHLGIDPTVPCLQTIVTSETGDGTPFEHTTSIFRGDLYEISL